MSYCISKSLYLACTDDEMNPLISGSAWVTSEVESVQRVPGGQREAANDTWGERYYQTAEPATFENVKCQRLIRL